MMFVQKTATNIPKSNVIIRVLVLAVITFVFC